MAKASKETASQTIELEGLEAQLEHFDGGCSVCFEFSPTDVLAQTIPVVMDNVQAAGVAARSHG